MSVSRENVQLVPSGKKFVRVLIFAIFPQPAKVPEKISSNGEIMDTNITCRILLTPSNYEIENKSFRKKDGEITFSTLQVLLLKKITEKFCLKIQSATI